MEDLGVDGKMTVKETVTEEYVQLILVAQCEDQSLLM